MMKLPHWLRHAWSEWKPVAQSPQMHSAYEWRNYDVRSCVLCGRRQMRAI